MRDYPFKQKFSVLEGINFTTMNLAVYYFFPYFFFALTISSPTEVTEKESLTFQEYDDTSSENFTDSLGTFSKNVSSECVKENLETDDVYFLEKGEMFHKGYNITLKPTELKALINDSQICFEPTDDIKREIFSKCDKWVYEKDEFQKLPNGSALLSGVLLEPLTYDFFQDGKLRTCVMDYDYDDQIGENFSPSVLKNADVVSMYLGNIGSAISIIALIAHIVLFCAVPALKNLPGYNLLSFSIAFLMAYFFTLFGQIPQVLGVLCVVSGVLEYYFFLAAFFCMNVVAFEVCKTLKMAVDKLAVRTQTARKRQFLWYSLYAWLSPMVITIACIVAEYSEGFPHSYKPLFGRNNECWMTNHMGKVVFFMIPAFVLFAINAVFFVISAYILQKNTMKKSEDENRKKVTMNLVLYVRVALMMGVNWLSGVIAVFVNDPILWYLADLLNSLQGLFVFILSISSKKVIIYVKEKLNMINLKNESDKTHKNKCDPK